MCFNHKPERETNNNMTGLAEELVQTDVDLMTSKIVSQWDWRTLNDLQQASLAYTSSSPDSSPYSSRSSPEPQGEYSEPSFENFTYSSPQGRTTGTDPRKHKPKMSSKRRMKASEREKLRMRSLAEALHQLRDYLPPVYNRKGQPLTKIQTLKYTIEYIKELSDILSQEERS